jgi:Fe-S oxidoreductase
LIRKHLTPNPQAKARVLFLSDAFTEYFHPQAGLAAVQVLQACGFHVRVLPVLGAGRTLISKGFLQAAKKQAERVLDAAARLDPEGCLPVVGVEPSEIYTLRDEYLDLFPGDQTRQSQARALAERAWMIDEFLVRPGLDGEVRLARLKAKPVQGLRQILLHGHCYQKAQPPAEDGYPTGVAATVAMLKMRGCQVQVIDATCCGMAGAFGYEAEHYALSAQVGELSLFPAVRQAQPEAIIAASGVSCQAQILDGTQREAVHPITVVANFT